MIQNDQPSPKEPRPPLVVRRATAEDLPALLDFVGQTYGLGAPFKDAARHAWQFEDNPFRPASETAPTIWLAFDGRRVVGEIAVQDGMLWHEAGPVPAGWIVDVMVHPDYRGQGLSHRIHEAIMVERPVLVTLTMAPATRRVAERAGCLTLGPTRQFILPYRLSTRTVMRFLAYKAGAGSASRRAAIRLFNASRIAPMILAGASRLFGAWRRWRAPKLLPARLSIAEVDHFPNSLDALWAANRGLFPAVFERSVRFLNWRFTQAPGLDYRCFLLRRDGSLVGYVVTRVGVKDELPLGVIVDVFADPRDHEALDALVAHACRVLRPSVEYIEAAASTPAWREALSRAGFIATKTMYPTVVCTDAELRDRLAQNPDGWHFTKADHDWDQVHPV
ncbi:GNAT family N-acetyltransferase [Flavimaricola marinus]|uniref:N-acetyltransferase domain-containing protein n=1 Tax=Flavimaricola marinus TaxID=1819565 RepID=A0A238LI46_9RHOB|nr:GNAT family N-acetyltransferase [Flavimaricola marinus]SMY09298.1 hypothetical protein LOM8899_03463 [Flavimaricola marinus]